MRVMHCGPVRALAGPVPAGTLCPPIVTCTLFEVFLLSPSLRCVSARCELRADFGKATESRCGGARGGDRNSKRS